MCDAGGEARDQRMTGIEQAGPAPSPAPRAARPRPSSVAPGPADRGFDQGRISDSSIMRKQATRRFLIVTGLLICTLALVPLLLSLFFEAGYFGARWGVCVGGCGVGLHHAPYPAWFPRGWVVIPAESCFSWLPYRGRNASNGLLVLMPLWPWVIAAATGVVVVWRCYGRILPGHCEACGYNLTGNESGVCPECGVGLRRSRKPANSRVFR